MQEEEPREQNLGDELRSRVPKQNGQPLIPLLLLLHFAWLLVGVVNLLLEENHTSLSPLHTVKEQVALSIDPLHIPGLYKSAFVYFYLQLN